MTDPDTDQLVSIAGMSPTEIEAARVAGRLRILLDQADWATIAAGDKARSGGVLDDDDVHRLFVNREYDAIVQARREGRIASLNEGA